MEEPLQSVEPVAVEGRIRIPYRWPAGRVAGRFLAALRDYGLLLGLRCPRCRTVGFPPRPRCLKCRAASEEWVPVGPDGAVSTWTVHRRLEPPQVLAVVVPDGADGGMLHRLIDIEPGAVQSGMRVTAVLAEERRGSIEDLAGFRPL